MKTNLKLYEYLYTYHDKNSSFLLFANLTYTLIISPFSLRRCDARQSIHLCICHYRQNDSGSGGGRAAMQVNAMRDLFAKQTPKLISCTWRMMVSRPHLDPPTTHGSICSSGRQNLGTSVPVPCGEGTSRLDTRGGYSVYAT